MVVPLFLDDTDHSRINEKIPRILSLPNHMEVIDMTDKELLYIEDALGHEQYFQQKCKETAQSLTDPELKTCVENLSTRHSTIFNRFYSLL